MSINDVRALMSDHYRMPGASTNAKQCLHFARLCHSWPALLPMLLVAAMPGQRLNTDVIRCRHACLKTMSGWHLVLMRNSDWRQRRMHEEARAARHLVVVGMVAGSAAGGVTACCGTPSVFTQPWSAFCTRPCSPAVRYEQETQNFSLN